MTADELHEMVRKIPGWIDKVRRLLIKVEAKTDSTEIDWPAWSETPFCSPSCICVTCLLIDMTHGTFFEEDDSIKDFLADVRRHELIDLNDEREGWRLPPLSIV